MNYCGSRSGIKPRRRDFLAIGGALVIAAFSAQAQRAERLYRIGFVSPTVLGPRSDAFLLGLRELGYVEGRNVSIAMRYAEGRYERFPALIEELVRLQVDVLVVGATIGARAAKEAKTTIPIVFAGSSDPVAGGIVSNLRRPGGNITGVSFAFGEGFSGKWLELLAEAVPGIANIAVLQTSVNAPSAARFAMELEHAARMSRTGITLHNATDLARLDQAFAAIRRSGAKGLIVTPSPFAATNREKLVQFAASMRVPAIYFVDDFVDAGGLMSYGPSIVDAYQRAAGYVDRILKGARPGDLPVEQPVRFDLVVNLKTAGELGLKVPQSILLRADRVIE